MGKGMQCMQNGPRDPMGNSGGWAIDRPGQSRESFGGGTQVRDIR